MSIDNSSSRPTNDASAVPLEPPMLTPEQFIEQVRMLRQQTPGYVQLTRRETKKLRRLTDSVTLEFAHHATNAVGTSGVVESAVGNTPEGMHQDNDLAGRWAAAQNEVRSLLRGMSSMNLVLRERLCRNALQAYNVSRQLVKQKEHAHLLPHVEAMRRLKKSHHRAKPATEPAPAKPHVVTEPAEKE